MSPRRKEIAMAARVRLTADVDPEVKKRVRIAAIESETSVSEWIERAVVRELERKAKDRSSDGSATVEPSRAETHAARPREDDYRTLLQAAVEDRDGLYLPPPGVKPSGSENPIKLCGGTSMADTIIEERGER
jgi:hypothetical protein